MAFRVYEPPAEQSHAFASTAIELESTLRDEGHLVFYDTTRRGIWHFCIREKDTALDAAGAELDPSLDLAGHSLVLAEEGTFEPLNLQKGRSPMPPTNNTPTSSSSTGSGLEHNHRHPYASSQSSNPNSNELDKPTGPSNADPKRLQASHKMAYENFIAAVLLAFSTAFCPVMGAIPLNYRTVLLPSNQTAAEDGNDTLADQDTVFGTLAAYLTTLGSLVVSFKVSQCKGLLPLDSAFVAGFTAIGQNILAAPFGIQATNPLSMLGDIGTASLTQTPNTQALSLRGPPDANEGMWRQACLKALQFRGISSSFLEGCPWVNISVSRRRLQAPKADPRRPKDVPGMITISWPRPLCFRQRVLETSTTSCLGYTVLNGHEESHDPLGNAGRWLHTGADREEQLSKRKADRSAPVPMEIDSNGTQAPNPSGHTPAALGRPSTAIVGAVYPTPPDGVPPTSGITPSFDGAASSPRNHLAAAAPVDSEDMGPEMTNSDGEIWDRPDSKQERSDSNNLLDDAENVLMGGGDMFGENDITEADFSFFDEQPGDMDLAMSDFDVSGTSSPQKQPIQKLEAPKPNSETPSTMPAVQDSGGFMKPELKHARSFLNDPQNAAAAGKKEPAPKRGSSPFDPEAVLKRVRGSLGTPSDSSGAPPPPKRRNSVFEKIDLGPTLPLMNKKYEQGGFFAVDQKKLDENKTGRQQSILPETNYLKRRNKRNRRLKDPPVPSGALMRRFTALEAPTAHPSPLRVVGSPSNDERSSVESDEDDSSYTSDDAVSPIKSSFKRAAFDDDVASPVTSFRDVDVTEEPDQQLAIELPRLSKPEPPETQLSKLFLDPEPPSFQMPLADEDVVNIAQFVTEQAATGFLNVSEPHKDEESLYVVRSKRQSLATSTRDSLSVLRSVIPLSLERGRSTHLKGFLEVQDVPLQGQPALFKPRPVPGRDPNSEQLKPSNLYQIPCHHLEVKRADSKLSVLPTAITFWESLGLAPASGSKNIHGLCVFPGWPGMMDNVRIFLERMKSVYELLRLGSFEKLPLSNELESGLVPFEVDRISTSPDASATGHGFALIESMDVLQAAMSSVSATETNFVVFMVYTPSNPGTIVEACLAFQRFVDSYWKPLVKKEHAQRELVLQLVSADFVSSPTSLVMTGSSDLARLCIETYDRCTMFGGPVPAPAIILEQALPRIIDFKLNLTPSASLIHENSCIHVGYAQSVDERWVTAAWTDDRGSQQATAAYCLGRKGRPLSTSMHEVAHEIWESTLDIISHRKVVWRIIITKSGNMESHEIEFWADLARTESKANIAMILMTVDTDPSLQLLPPAVQVPSSTVGFYTTPVSTPQANIVSPEQTNAPATPMRDSGAAAAPTPSADATGEPESDAALLDVTDQTWGAVVGHRLNNSSTPLELQPALVSGYLIKKTSTKLEDPPTVMEVNLVHTESTARAYEPLLREMLSNFRGLSTLARVRGVVERDADVRPWHVAVAEKAVRALYMLM